MAAENARAGTSQHAGSEDGDAVLGYLDRSSAGCGERIGIHLAVAPGQASRRVWLAAYRIGWYGGKGARLAWRSPTLWVAARAVPSGAAPPHLVTPAWPTSLSMTMDAGWLPGFYLIIPQDAAGAGPAGPAVPLVVRDDGGIEPILVKASTLTWNAYNDWGGWSLYHGPNGSHAEAVADRARVVALHRPLTGSGYRQMKLMDLPVVRLAEQLSASRRIDVAYTTDVDVHRDPAQLTHHAEVVSGGHSEYWTTSMYDGLQAAVAAGVNLVFLGANNLWWHTRLEGGGPAAGRAGRPDRQVVYRLLAEDPAARIDPLAATVQWQIAPLFRDPAALLGQSHAAINVDGGLQLLDPPAWFTAGTGLRAGAVLKEAIGNEADGFNPRGHNPAHTQILAAALLTGAHGPVLVSTSYSTQPSGAAVFAAGSTDWACAPTGTCADKTIPASTGRLIGALTSNVLLALSTPRAGLTHPAHATPLMNAT
ncbi:MAG TPA: N,N-dimethylformamidase beta subunit family domain-containing protein, partial [Kineosporiaceae bacterium]|nr:N,N-dimethylformamidase beta subunit family domain-containing protein [Kineosporiaceae bacterium]